MMEASQKYNVKGATLRKLIDGWRLHTVFMNGDICLHCMFDAVSKRTTETPVELELITGDLQNNQSVKWVAENFPYPF